MARDLDSILSDLDALAHVADPHERFGELVRAALDANAAAQPDVSAAVHPSADVTDRLARVAQRISAELAKIAQVVRGASWSVAVSWPPGIQVGVSWGGHAAGDDETAGPGTVGAGPNS
ncbi:MAG: hypothetical protein EPN43_05375 [Jatrophihabitans sp.]|nr:MAG: hypothetical protein EPN43_05375 [Jatrophihabitans sp.]